MAGVGPSDLFNECQALLSASVECLDTIPSSSPGLQGAPERAYVSAGTPVLYQCDQLIVNATPILEAPAQPLEMGAGTRHQQQFRKNYVGFNVTIARCATGVAEEIPPPTSLLEDVAEQTDADAWCLWNCLWNEARAGEIFSICSGVYFDRIAPLTPSGGVFGWVLSIRAEVQGYEGVP